VNYLLVEYLPRSTFAFDEKHKVEIYSAGNKVLGIEDLDVALTKYIPGNIHHRHQRGRYAIGVRTINNIDLQEYFILRVEPCDFGREAVSVDIYHLLPQHRIAELDRIPLPEAKDLFPYPLYIKRDSVIAEFIYDEKNKRYDVKPLETIFLYKPLRYRVWYTVSRRRENMIRIGNNAKVICPNCMTWFPLRSIEDSRRRGSDRVMVRIGNLDIVVCNHNPDNSDYVIPLDDTQASPYYTYFFKLRKEDFIRLYDWRRMKKDKVIEYMQDQREVDLYKCIYASFASVKGTTISVRPGMRIPRIKRAYIRFIQGMLKLIATTSSIQAYRGQYWKQFRTSFLGYDFKQAPVLNIDLPIPIDKIKDAMDIFDGILCRDSFLKLLRNTTLYNAVLYAFSIWLSFVKFLVGDARKKRHIERVFSEPYHTLRILNAIFMLNDLRYLRGLSNIRPSYSYVEEVLNSNKAEKIEKIKNAMGISKSYDDCLFESLKLLSRIMYGRRFTLIGNNNVGILNTIIAYVLDALNDNKVKNFIGRSFNKEDILYDVLMHTLIHAIYRGAIELEGLPEELLDTCYKPLCIYDSSLNSIKYPYATLIERMSEGGFGLIDKFKEDINVNIIEYLIRRGTKCPVGCAEELISYYLVHSSTPDEAYDLIDKSTKLEKYLTSMFYSSTEYRDAKVLLDTYRVNVRDIRLDYVLFDVQKILADIERRIERRLSNEEALVAILGLLDKINNEKYHNLMKFIKDMILYDWAKYLVETQQSVRIGNIKSLVRIFKGKEFEDVHRMLIHLLDIIPKILSGEYSCWKERILKSIKEDLEKRGKKVSDEEIKRKYNSIIDTFLITCSVLCNALRPFVLRTCISACGCCLVRRSCIVGHTNLSAYLMSRHMLRLFLLLLPRIYEKLGLGPKVRIDDEHIMETFRSIDELSTKEEYRTIFSSSIFTTVIRRNEKE